MILFWKKNEKRLSLRRIKIASMIKKNSSLRNMISLVMVFLLSFPFMAQAQSIEDVRPWLVEMGQVTPDFQFTWKDGKTEEIVDYRGKVVMINFFATWCPPCRAELPRVQEEIWDKYKDHPEFQLFVFGREEDWDVLDPFIASTGYTFPILPDLQRGIFGQFATQSIPRNVILDREGKIIYQSIGYTVPEFDKMLELLEGEIQK